MYVVADVIASLSLFEYYFVLMTFCSRSFQGCFTSLSNIFKDNLKILLGVAGGIALALVSH